MVDSTVTSAEFHRKVPKGWAFQAAAKLPHSACDGHYVGGQVNNSGLALMAVTKVQ